MKFKSRLFNAAYAKTIDSGAMEQWPTFFTKDCHYRVTNVDNHAEGLAAGIVWADSQDMLTDRISAARSQYLRAPSLSPYSGSAFDPVRRCNTGQCFHAVHGAAHHAYRETEVFASGEYLDKFTTIDGKLRLQERIAVCDSTVTDTLMALPL